MKGGHTLSIFALGAIQARVTDSYRSHASVVGSFFTVDFVGGAAGVAEAAATKGKASFCSRSTACQNEIPSARITQSITVPPT